MRKYALALIVALVSLAPMVGAQTVGVGGVVFAGSNSSNPTGAITIGADILGVRTDIEYGVLNLRLWLSKVPFGTAETGATVDTQRKINLWQPRSRDLGYRYLVGSIDVSGVDERRLKDAKGWLKSACGCTPLVIQGCGCVRQFSIELDTLSPGVYAIDLASYNDAKKNSLKWPGGSLGINRETQRVSGYYQFTMFDPCLILTRYWQNVTDVPNSEELKRRIEDAYLLQMFAYATMPSMPDLDLAKLEGQYNNLAVQTVQGQNYTSSVRQSAGYSFQLRVTASRPFQLQIRDCHNRPAPRTRSWQRPAGVNMVQIDVTAGDYVEYNIGKGFTTVQPGSIPANGTVEVPMQ